VHACAIGRCGNADYYHRNVTIHPLATKQSVLHASQAIDSQSRAAHDELSGWQLRIVARTGGAE